MIRARAIGVVLALCACLAHAQQAPAPASTRALSAQAQTLRAQLGPSTGTMSEDRADFLRRLLIASLERRMDMVRSIRDVQRLSEHVPKQGPTPTTLLALDDVRSELQRLDAELASGERRRVLLEAERTSTAAQLTQKVAAERTLADAGATPDAIAIAKLETALSESATAEIDMMLQLIHVQQTFSQAQRDAAAATLASAKQENIAVTDRDAAQIDARLKARATELRRLMAEATSEREASRTALAQAKNATPLQLEAMKERVANADIEIELLREASTNLSTEQITWQTAVRVYRDHDESAIIEARRYGPDLIERFTRRREFLDAMSNQVLARSGALSTDIVQAPGAPDVADKRALRDVFDQRLQMVQRARFDEARMIDLVERMRDDFDARASAYGVKERLGLAWAFLRDGVARLWNFELFTVNQTVEVDGRKTDVPRGVTVGKVVQAPLLLVVGLFLAAKLTTWWQRWLRRRRHMDDGRARLLARWAFALLVAACVLASLAIAGIPLAAFAFIGGAVAIGIGFGMQTLFKNLISGVLVLIERPFRLGDVIEVGALRGMVVDIDLRTSVVRDADGADTLIPNSVLMEENVKNVTYRTRMQRQQLAVVVEGHSDPRAVSDAMVAAAVRHGQLAESPEPTVLLEDFADNGLKFVLHYWIELVPGMDRRRVASDLRMMILGAFADAGIAMAPPPPLVR